MSTPRFCMVSLCALVGAGLASCAPASVATQGAGVEDACPIEPARFGVFDTGDVPLVVTATHAGLTTPLGCAPGDDALRAIEARACDGADACASGPCRAGAGDRGARLIAFALVEELARCLGGRPHLALAEVSRTLVDMNRDAHDPGGLACAMQDAAALPYWEAWHRGVEDLVARADDQARARGAKALLVDVHTYAALPDAPPPAVMLGAGDPFGSTLPLLAREDPSFERVFGAAGLRALLLAGLAPVVHARAGAAQGDAAGEAAGALAVLPASRDASLEGLFAGRYVVHRYARLVEGPTQRAGPAVDALQIEMSDGVRDDELGAAHALAQAICGAFGDRVRGAPGATTADAATASGGPT